MSLLYGHEHSKFCRIEGLLLPGRPVTPAEIRDAIKGTSCFYIQSWHLQINSLLCSKYGCGIVTWQVPYICD